MGAFFPFTVKYYLIVDGYLIRHSWGFYGPNYSSDT